MLKDFLLMVLGNAIFYEMLFKLTDYGADRKFFGIQFQSDFWYTAFFTLITLPLTYLGALVFNYAYLKQGMGHDANLWFPQFMVWCAAPIAFTLLNTFQRGSALEWRTAVSLALLALAMLVRYYK